jgi:hypothetical protein
MELDVEPGAEKGGSCLQFFAPLELFLVCNVAALLCAQPPHWDPIRRQ